MNDAAPAKTVLTTAGLRRGGRWQQAFVPIKNEPGELLRLDKRMLQIDPLYQRKLWPNRVARIAANWSWVSCGSLIVSQRPGTEFYFLIDGQHRWEAAKLLDHVRSLPCLRFELDMVKDEAIGFLACNTERKFPSLAEQFKALIIAEDRAALVAKELADSAGRHVSAPSGPTNISAVSEFIRLIQADELAVKRVWPVLSGLCRGRAMTARMMRGVVGLERRMPRGQTLGHDSYWGARILRVGYDQIDQSIRQLALIEGSASERACAEAIARMINRGRGNTLNINWERGTK